MWFAQYHVRTDIPDIPKSEAYKNNLHTVTYFVMVGMHWDITAKDSHIAAFHLPLYLQRPAV